MQLSPKLQVKKKIIKRASFCGNNTCIWLAKKCLKALKGLGGNNNNLFRVLISREEIDMYTIRDYYFMVTNSDIR